LAALQSKNVILNTLTVGNATSVDTNNLADAWAQVFDLSRYENSPNDFDDIQILGVEASMGSAHHVYHAFDFVANEEPSSLPATESDALQISFNGSNTGPSGMVDSGKSLLIGQHISGGIGPTAAGYRAKSISFKPVDMSTGATVVTNTDNPLTLPFSSFPFYGETEEDVFVSSNGTIYFDTGFPPQSNADLSRIPLSGEPSRGEKPYIAVLSWFSVNWSFDL
jgi:hypothetical protein